MALGIIGMAILALLGAFIAGNKLMANSGNISTATEIGRDFLESVKTAGVEQTVPGVFNGLQGDPPDFGVGFPAAPYPSKKLNGTNYSLVVECQDFGTDGRLIKVDVYWSKTSKVSLATVIR